VDPFPGNFDRDVDSNPGRPPRRPVESLLEHQRIVVNPFLAVLGWVAVFGIIRRSIQIKSMPLFLAGDGLLLAACLLLQFHCLDCGATGWLLRYKKHACSAVVMRAQNLVTRRFRAPGVKAQLVAWCVFTGSALVVGVVAFLSR
jgi:hypothetical protein